jgi:hypothetical protein
MKIFVATENLVFDFELFIEELKFHSGWPEDSRCKTTPGFQDSHIYSDDIFYKFSLS